MKIGVLTSSRADYSIYLPLLKAFRSDPYFQLTLIAFGTHLSKNHGYTVKEIEKDGFEAIQKINTPIPEGSPASISSSIGTTILKFTELWKDNQFDLLFSLGDRFEMFAAVTSTLPFNLRVAHLHGGETTLGAIDNSFRHSISLMSTLHFVSTSAYENRLIELLGYSNGVYNVGALSYENFLNLELLTVSQFKEAYGIDLDEKTILCTFHPETVSYEKNIEYIAEFIDAIKKLDYLQFLITMPNVDTMGGYIRSELLDLILTSDHVKGVESLGTEGYLSAMKHCEMVLGNSSSGFVDASFFPKKVINMGRRQDGRVRTKNIYDCEIESEQIQKMILRILNVETPLPLQIYGDGSTSKKIIEIIKDK